MRYMLPLLAAGGLCLPLSALANKTPAHDYPTQARVEYVYECMNRLGGENYDTLYKCACSIDRIADELPYDEYVTLDTYQRGQNAAGERPEVLREGSIARDSRSQLAAVKARANQQCMIETEKDTND